MNKYHLKTRLAMGLLISMMFAASGAHAGSLFRAYLSIKGVDSNPCTVTLPCRLLPAALAAAQDGGEVWMLDSANYNTGVVTINQSVTILAVPGTVGSLLATNANAIVIGSTSIGNLNVTLRNLVLLNNGGSSNSGVEVDGAYTQLIVEGSEFSGLNQGVYIFAQGGQAQISRSVFRGNTTAISVVGNATGSAQSAIDHCTMIGGNYGVSGLYSNVTISHSSVTNNYWGVYAFAGMSIVLEDDMITQNAFGAEFDSVSTGGIISTNGNNTFQFNTNDVSNGTLTTTSHM